MIKKQRKIAELLAAKENLRRIGSTDDIVDVRVTAEVFRLLMGWVEELAQRISWIVSPRRCSNCQWMS